MKENDTYTDIRSNVKRCRKCGKPVSVISFGIYRNVLVDINAIPAVPDMCGEQFIRVDGTKMRGRPVDIEESPVLVNSKNAKASERIEYVYRPHTRTCGLDE